MAVMSRTVVDSGMSRRSADRSSVSSVLADAFALPDALTPGVERSLLMGDELFVSVEEAARRIGIGIGWSALGFPDRVGRVPGRRYLMGCMGLVACQPRPWRTTTIAGVEPAPSDRLEVTDQNHPRHRGHRRIDRTQHHTTTTS